MVKTCPTCAPLCVVHPVRTAAEWEAQLEILLEHKQSGLLEIVDGGLAWSDVIECTLKCASCGQLFNVAVETYHGSGGQWGPINRS